MSEDYLARVQVYCDDPSLNFHKRHGRSWVADFRKMDYTTEIQAALDELELDYLAELDRIARAEVEAEPLLVSAAIAPFDLYHGATGWISQNEPVGWTNFFHSRTRSFRMSAPYGDERVQEPPDAFEFPFTMGRPVVGAWTAGGNQPSAQLTCACRAHDGTVPLEPLAIALDALAAAGVAEVPLATLARYVGDAL